MKNKKLIIFIIAMVVLLCAAGGTYAYYTTDLFTHNVISSGKVDVEIIELANMDGAEFKDVVGAMPGKVYDKIVMAENTGSGDAWIRIKLVKAVQPAKGVTAQLNPDLVKLDILNDGWTEQGGWYYCNEALKPGLKTKPILSSVGLDFSMGNEWQNAKLTIDVYLEAVQVANNGNTVLEAAGWPDKY